MTKWQCCDLAQCLHFDIIPNWDGKECANCHKSCEQCKKESCLGSIKICKKCGALIHNKVCSACDKRYKLNQNKHHNNRYIHRGK